MCCYIYVPHSLLLSRFEAVVFHMGIVGSSVVEDSPASAGDAGDPGRPPGGRDGNPL